MYVLQHNGYQLGNFINCTPTIRGLAEYYGQPINVLFQTDYIKQAYRDCMFIRAIDEPKGEMLFGSHWINTSIPDWRYIYLKVQSQLGIKFQLKEPYIDKCDVKTNMLPNAYYVIARGCLSHKDTKVKQKDPGDRFYNFVLKATDLPAVYVASQKDRDWFLNWWSGRVATYNTSIREALGIIDNAQFVVSNDTGLYHAAAALKKPVFVAWKNTIFIKNKAIGEARYSRNNWEQDYLKWISTLQLPHIIAKRN